MRIPGRNLLRSAERAGNRPRVPMTRDLGLVDLLKLTLREMQEDHVSAYAGNLTYKVFFAIFPFFTLLLSLLGLFDATDLVRTMLENLSRVMPQSALRFVESQLLSITQSQAEGAFTAGAVISILLALWGVSGAMRSVMEAMNVMYEVEENRPFWKVYGISILISLAVAALLILALLLLVFGAAFGGGLASLVGLGPVFAAIWSVAQWPILACFVLFAFALVYYFAPAVEQRWRWISAGSVLAFVFWLIFSLAFSLYVANFGSYNATYGSLAGIIIFLLYVYYSSLIVLLGAELNQVIEWHIPEGKDEGERAPKDGAP
ncbi:ribonuclease BN, putative [Rubrobacter xylanophilus DSM 9941]|uniref:Ribonuclease BN, putative n=1 Tax=Rubrobacter xylanophilus (strain DSM 9941 / JCM 11954 / NBRC 16129 / PRD-1) TaxID=266117 RepID=Q1AW58_RUBXD|nr:YihY/virulence factor BrkB family protein [Rubrobacter xylanophilus]ABG04370.1 ribonuclease BN, putative [Rubrobacter xylanophilus DSM 9941]